jgi:hypothetical protein
MLAFKSIFMFMLCKILLQTLYGELGGRCAVCVRERDFWK